MGDGMRYPPASVVPLARRWRDPDKLPQAHARPSSATRRGRAKEAIGGQY